MKNIMTIVVLSSVILFSCNQTKVPKVVQEAFLDRYGNATDIEWEKEGMNWEVEFNISDNEMTAEFDADGKWLETEWEIGMDKLPHVVADSIAYGYKDYDIKEVQQVDSPDFKGYVIDIVKDDLELEIRATEYGILDVKEEVDAMAEDDQDENKDHDRD